MQGMNHIIGSPYLRMEGAENGYLVELLTDGNLNGFFFPTSMSIFGAANCYRWNLATCRS